MCVRTSWIISVVAIVIAIGFSVTDCSGWPFDSAEEEARADIQRDNAATDNRIRLDTHKHQLSLERMAMFGGGPSPWTIIMLGFACLVIIMALTAATLIILAAMRDRRQGFHTLRDSRQAVIDSNGNEYLVNLEPVNKQIGVR